MSSSGMCSPGVSTNQRPHWVPEAGGCNGVLSAGGQRSRRGLTCLSISSRVWGEGSWGHFYSPL